MNSTEGGVVVVNGSKSLLVSEVKGEQDQDLICVELNSNVYKQKKVMAFK